MMTENIISFQQEATRLEPPTIHEQKRFDTQIKGLTTELLDKVQSGTKKTKTLNYLNEIHIDSASGNTPTMAEAVVRYAVLLAGYQELMSYNIMTHPSLRDVLIGANYALGNLHTAHEFNHRDSTLADKEIFANSDEVITTFESNPRLQQAAQHIPELIAQCYPNIQKSTSVSLKKMQKDALALAYLSTAAVTKPS